MFFPEYSKYGWNELDNKGKLGTLKGEKINFYLSLFSLPDDIKKIKNQKKGYTLIERATYLLEGSIVEKITAKDLAILDCKMPVYVHLESKGDLNKGDWIEAKGRLDAYLIESKK